MNVISQYFTSQRWPFLAVLASAIILGGAYFFEFVLGYDPCALCYDQRNIHQAAIAVGVIGGLAVMADARAKYAIWVCIILAAVYAYSAYFSGWHAGIEYGWWQGPATCTNSGPIDSSDVSFEALQAMMAGEHRAAMCDEAPWTLLGISMAGYNAIMSAGLMALSLVAGLFRK